MDQSYSLELDFLTDFGNKTMRITVRNANPDATEVQIRAAMTVICQKGAAGLILSNSAGFPIAIKAASLVDRGTIAYNLD